MRSKDVRLFGSCKPTKKVNPPPPQDASWRNNYREEKSRGKQQKKWNNKLWLTQILFIGKFLIIYVDTEEQNLRRLFCFQGHESSLFP
jgi:hypothetical protein